jgi:hypothetical protein
MRNEVKMSVVISRHATIWVQLCFADRKSNLHMAHLKRRGLVKGREGEREKYGDMSVG